MRASSSLQTKLIEKRLDYDGTQLKSLFAYMNESLLGDSIVAFRGACSVSFEHMVDGEDLLAHSEIRGSDMVHFIIEHFQMSLPEAVARQRLFASIVGEVIAQVSGTKLKRVGDDLYLDDGKFSISIATQSPVSALIHFAFNISNDGTPVKTSALADLGLADWQPIATEILAAYSQENQAILEATCKVKWVP